MNTVGDIFRQTKLTGDI